MMQYCKSCIPAVGVSEELVFDLAKCKAFPEVKKSFVDPALNKTNYRYCDCVRTGDTCENYEEAK
jgi:hypothetical protein